MDARNPSLLTTRGINLAVAGRSLINALDWQVRAGEFWCVLGPNGAGKTTLLRRVAGLDATGEASGSIRCAERTLAEWDRRQLARVRGFMAQHSSDAFDATVLDTVLLGRHPHLDRWRWERDTDSIQALSALSRVGLNGCAMRNVRSLSGGERQRVALAALLTQAPRLYLADEPVSHQDLHHQHEVLKLLTDLARCGAAVIATMHDINLAAGAATHVLLLDGQGGTSAGPVNEVLTPERLGTVFGHALTRLSHGGRDWFVPA